MSSNAASTGQETEQDNCYEEVLPTSLLLNKVLQWSGGSYFGEEELSRSPGPR